MSTAPSISLLGSSALLFEAPGELDLAPQQRIWRLALQAGEWPEIHEAVHNLRHALQMHAGRWNPAEIERVRALLNDTAKAIVAGPAAPPQEQPE